MRALTSGKFICKYIQATSYIKQIKNSLLPLLIYKHILHYKTLGSKKFLHFKQVSCTILNHFLRQVNYFPGGRFVNFWKQGFRSGDRKIFHSTFCSVVRNIKNYSPRWPTQLYVYIYIYLFGSSKGSEKWDCQRGLHNLREKLHSGFIILKNNNVVIEFRFSVSLAINPAPMITISSDFFLSLECSRL